MTPFERDKRARNLRDGYQETKGLKNGHCNRYACQAPLYPDEPQGYMTDHETHVEGARLYYCSHCSHLFIRSDRQFNESQRITWDEPTEDAPEVDDPTLLRSSESVLQDHGMVLHIHDHQRMKEPIDLDIGPTNRAARRAMQSARTAPRKGVRFR